MTVLSANAPITRVFGAPVGAVVATILDRLNRRRVYKMTVRELSALSAHELDDIGLTRQNIQAAAYDAAYGN